MVIFWIILETILAAYIITGLAIFIDGYFKIQFFVSEPEKLSTKDLAWLGLGWGLAVYINLKRKT